MKAHTSRVQQSGAIVLGGDYRALGVVRALGRRGVEVWVVADEHRVAATSRYCRRRLHWPADEGGQRELLEVLSAEAPGWVLICSGDESSAHVARRHEQLSRQFRLTTPPWEQLQWAHDKRRTRDLGERLGMPVPRTVAASEALATGSPFALPAILKPAIKLPGAPLSDDKAWPVADEAELRERFAAAAKAMPPETIMLQELVAGGGEAQMSWGALCRDGTPLLSVTAQRLRQHPIDFGKASSYVVTCEDEEIERLGEAVAADLRWTGLIEVEFKRGPDGGPRLLDINPRVWGWASIGARAGVDFGWGLYRLATDQPVERARARPGVRWIRLSTDVLAAAAYRRAGELTLAAWLRSLPRTEGAIAASDDPVPAVLDVPLHVARAARKRHRPAAGDLEVEISERSTDEEWDAFVGSVPGGSHVQTTRWAAVKHEIGWRSARVVVRRQGAIVGGCQLLLSRAGPFSLAYAPRAPLLAPDEATVLDAVVDGMRRTGGRQPLSYLKVQPPTDRHDLGERLVAHGFVASDLEAAPRATVLVDLTATPEEMLARMRSGVRANIRKAQRRGITVRIGGADDFDIFDRLVQATSRRQGFDPYPTSYFRRMWTEFAAADAACLCIAEHEGRALSTALVVGGNDTAAFKMAGWTGESSPLRPNELTHWTAMQWARERGYRYYDFEGFPPHVERALARGDRSAPEQDGVGWFKLGFGGEVHVFPGAYDTSHSRLLRPALRVASPRLGAARGVALRLLGRR